jgi:hypothetical protein
MTTTKVTLTKLPLCNFCEKTAKYDFKTRTGPWAYGCQLHYEVNRAYSQLGTGKGQELILS